MSIFPILRAAVETPHYTSSANEYRKPFLDGFRAAFPRKSYYAFDVTILSRTEVEFTAYDMFDNLSGGIGDKIGSFNATVPESMTHNDIERAIRRAAAIRRADELADEEDRIIAVYADEIRAALA